MAANFGSSSNFQRSYGYSSVICILRVDARVPGWQRAAREVLGSIRGVYNFKMVPNGLIEVSGTVHPNLVLDRICRTGIHAEMVSVQSRESSSYSYTPGHGGGQGHGYRGYGRFGGGMESSPFHGRSYGGYWNHSPRPYTCNRPFGGLAESIVSPSSPGWFWH